MTVHSQEIADLWAIAKYCRHRPTQEAGANLFHWLSLHDGDQIAMFLVGKAPHPTGRGEIHLDGLEAEIIKTFRPNRIAVDYLNALAVVIDRGNKQKLFDICLPRIPTLLTLETSPFLEENLDELPLVRLWRQKTREGLPLDPAQQTDAYLGWIFCSAVLNGGLLEKSLLKCLCEKLAEPIELITPLLTLNAHLSFLVLDVPVNKFSPPERRRWFPDPLTEMLILRLPAAVAMNKALSGKELSSGAIFRCIEKFLTLAGVKKGERPASLKDFFDAVHFGFHIYLPPFLANYAKRLFISHSVRPHVWKRFFWLMTPCKREPIPQDPPVQEETSHDGDAFQAEDAEEDDEAFMQVSDDWIVRIREALRQETSKKMCACIEVVLADKGVHPYSPESIMAGWLHFLLTNTSSYGNKLRPSTIANYVGRTLIRITSYIGDVGNVDDRDITTLEGEGLEEMYIQILEDIRSQSYRTFIARALREFHHYLVEVHHLAPINYREILGIGMTSSVVDANLISLDEYQSILRHLETNVEAPAKPDLYRAAQLIVILAFRCGLRRNEVYKLQIDDFQNLVKPDLLIRDNDHRSVKTKNSVRMAPLELLLEREELSLLIMWKEKRLREEDAGGGGEKFLFAAPKLRHELIPERTIFNEIRKAMHAVTGDRTLRFHHLRHSFGSWMMLHLAMKAIEPTPASASLFSVSGLSHLSPAERLAQEANGFDGPTRKSLYMISSFLGHSSPDISLEHYLHFCDIALKIGIDTHLGGWDVKALTLSSGVPISTAYRWLSEDGFSVQTLMARIRDKAAKMGRALKNVPIEAPEPLPDEPDEELCDEATFLKRLHSFLILKSLDRIDQGTIERRLLLEIQDDKVDRIERRATRGREMAPKNKKGFRHRVQSLMPDKRDPSQIIRTLAPVYPRLKRDQEVFNEYAPKVWKMNQEAPQILREILILFMKNTWHTRNELIFHGRKEEERKLAVNYLKFLKAIGIGKNRLRFLSYDSRRSSPEREEWRKILGLSGRDRLDIVKPTNNKSKAVNFWLGIKPVLFVGKGMEDFGSAGYRFLMNMMAIYIDYSDFLGAAESRTGVSSRIRHSQRGNKGHQ